MPPVLWPLRNDRPMIEIVMSAVGGGQDQIRCLLADTGAGSQQTIFQLLLAEMDCLLAGGRAGIMASWNTFPQYRKDDKDDPVYAQFTEHLRQLLNANEQLGNVCRVCVAWKFTFGDTQGHSKN